jgi:hypothetical protein
MDMNIDDKLDALKGIKEVDAPPFLFTRIRQRINNLQNVAAPVKWKWAFALTSVVILAITLSILINFVSVIPATKNTEAQTIVNLMNLSSKNDLYNE